MGFFGGMRVGSEADERVGGVESLERLAVGQSPGRIEELVGVFVQATKVRAVACGWCLVVGDMLMGVFGGVVGDWVLGYGVWMKEDWFGVVGWCWEGRGQVWILRIW